MVAPVIYEIEADEERARSLAAGWPVDVAEARARAHTLRIQTEDAEGEVALRARAALADDGHAVPWVMSFSPMPWTLRVFSWLPR